MRNFIFIQVLYNMFSFLYLPFQLTHPEKMWTQINAHGHSREQKNRPTHPHLNPLHRHLQPCPWYQWWARRCIQTRFLQVRAGRPLELHHRRLKYAVVRYGPSQRLGWTRRRNQEKLGGGPKDSRRQRVGWGGVGWGAGVGGGGGGVVNKPYVQNGTCTGGEVFYCKMFHPGTIVWGIRVS